VRFFFRAVGETPWRQEVTQELWALLLPEYLQAPPVPVACIAGVVSLRDAEPFFFCFRPVPTFGYPSLMSSLSDSSDLYLEI
jgi:hypothetical protein